MLLVYVFLCWNVEMVVEMVMDVVNLHCLAGKREPYGLKHLLLLLLLLKVLLLLVKMIGELLLLLLLLLLL